MSDFTAQCDPRFDSPGVAGTRDDWVAFARSVVAIAKEAEAALAQVKDSYAALVDTFRMACEQRDKAEAALAEARERGDVLAQIVERQGRCSQCGQPFTERECGFTHATIKWLLYSAPPAEGIHVNCEHDLFRYDPMGTMYCDGGPPAEEA